MTWQELEKQEPYCQFYVERSVEDMRTPFTIEPDTFVVNRVFRRRDITSLQVPAFAVAGEDLSDLAGLQLAMGGDGESEVGNPGSSQRTMSTYMELSSDSQPDVKHVICSQWADPALRYHVSVEEIIRSLGDLAEFTLPG